MFAAPESPAKHFVEKEVEVVACPQDALRQFLFAFEGFAHYSFSLHSAVVYPDEEEVEKKGTSGPEAIYELHRLYDEAAFLLEVRVHTLLHDFFKAWNEEYLQHVEPRVFKYPEDVMMLIQELVMVTLSSVQVWREEKPLVLLKYHSLGGKGVLYRAMAPALRTRKHYIEHTLYGR